LFGGGNIICGHSENASMIVGIDDGPFDYAKPLYSDGALYSLHMSKVARDRRFHKVGKHVANSNGAASVETDSEKVRAIGDIMTGDDPNVTWSASLEATWGHNDRTVRCDRTAEMLDVRDTVLVAPY